MDSGFVIFVGVLGFGGLLIVRLMGFFTRLWV